jgi:peptide/nickel transport system permease protein
MSIVAFALIHLVPGDPARATLGFRATPQQLALRRHELGLDQPIFVQYWRFISGAATGDLGRSTSSGEDVGSLIARRAVPSLLLVMYTLMIALLIALPLATIGAVVRKGWIQQVIRLLSTITFVMPVFWLALLLIIVFSVRLGVLPTSGYGDTFLDHLRGLTLPALTVGLALSPLLVRLLLSSMIQTLQSDFVQAARARGLTETRVLFKHVLRNSVTMTVTVLGILLGVLLSVNVIGEEIFAIPGLGSLLVSAVGSRDYPVVTALTLLFGVAMSLSSLLADVAYAVLDPRVRL